MSVQGFEDAMCQAANEQSFFLTARPASSAWAQGTKLYPFTPSPTNATRKTEAAVESGRPFAAEAGARVESSSLARAV